MFDDIEKGSITVIAGPMFAGKTLELLRVIDQLDFSKKRYFVFKPMVDKVSKDKIESRWTKSKKAIVIKDSKELREVVKNDFNSKNNQKLFAIIIDEIQFFDEGIVEVLDELANNGLNIIAAGLDRDFLGNPFKVTSSVCGIAENVNKLYSICKVCGSTAYMSQKIVNGKPVVENELDTVVELKNKAQYIPVCRKHFVKKGK